MDRGMVRLRTGGALACVTGSVRVAVQAKVVQAKVVQVWAAWVAVRVRGFVRDLAKVAAWAGAWAAAKVAACVPGLVRAVPDPVLAWAAAKVAAWVADFAHGSVRVARVLAVWEADRVVQV